MLKSNLKKFRGMRRRSLFPSLGTCAYNFRQTRLQAFGSNFLKKIINPWATERVAKLQHLRYITEKKLSSW